VRFDNLLGRVPHRQSLGFGGQAGGVGFGGGQAGGDPDHDYDRGLVQKLILVHFKCVALTTREARYGTVQGTVPLKRLRLLSILAQWLERIFYTMSTQRRYTVFFGPLFLFPANG